jgi:hypothetical protein
MQENFQLGASHILQSDWEGKESGMRERWQGAGKSRLFEPAGAAC